MVSTYNYFAAIIVYKFEKYFFNPINKYCSHCDTRGNMKSLMRLNDL